MASVRVDLSLSVLRDDMHNVTHRQEMRQCINPLSPHDALKLHFTSLKTDLIFLQPRVLERKFP